MLGRVFKVLTHPHVSGKFVRVQNVKNMDSAAKLCSGIRVRSTGCMSVCKRAGAVGVILSAFAAFSAAQEPSPSMGGPATQADESGSPDGNGSHTPNSDIVLYVAIALGLVAVLVFGACFVRRYRERHDNHTLEVPTEPIKDGDAIAYRAMPFGGHKRFWDKVANEMTTKLGTAGAADKHIYIDVRPDPGEHTV